MKDSVLGVLNTSLSMIIPQGRYSPFVTSDESRERYLVHVHTARK